jgi:hypothetical protein
MIFDADRFRCGQRCASIGALVGVVEIQATRDRVVSIGL